MSRLHINKPAQPEIVQFKCLEDNYCCLIHDPQTKTTLVIDTPDADEISHQLEQRGWQLNYILTTHHHWDHIDGHEVLKQRYQCQIIGSELNRDQIPNIDQTVAQQDQLQLGKLSVHVIATPGHTLGHVVYYFPELEAVFVGDTLFSMGCGRLFEGSAAQMWESIQQLRALPESTAIYCGHEYTQSNARFAQQLEPDNQLLKLRVQEVDALRQKGLPTLPTSVRLERHTNPFMRVDQLALQQALNLVGHPPEQVFAEIRQRKDQA